MNCPLPLVYVYEWCMCLCIRTEKILVQKVKSGMNSPPLLVFVCKLIKNGHCTELKFVMNRPFLLVSNK